MNKIWQKDDISGQDRAWFDRFTTTEDRSYDQFLLPYDIIGNFAQASMLHRMGIYAEDEFNAVSGALKSYYRQWKDGKFTLLDTDEDVHSCIERNLIADCGDAGKKIHTGRSRNDQVATDVRLFLKDTILEIASDWIAIIDQLEGLRLEGERVFFAGLTHTQPAMPTSVANWCAGWQDMLLADIRSIQSAYREVNRSPLGSPAGYGVPYFTLDRAFAAGKMGFPEVQWAVNAVQPGRGVLERRVVDALGYAAHTYNRLAADMILFAHPAFGYFRFSDDQTSGSSIMPQKRNPDAWELIRAGSHRFNGIAAELASEGSNLTSGYHRDLQVTKRAVMDGIFAAKDLTQAVQHCIRGTEINPEACARSLTPEVFATHEANRLVAGGMPFRDAYRLAGKNADQSVVPDDEALQSSYDRNNQEMHAKYVHEQRSAASFWIDTQRQKNDKIIHTLLH